MDATPQPQLIIYEKLISGMKFYTIEVLGELGYKRICSIKEMYRHYGRTSETLH